ncbi:hypothetical protein NZD88_19570 [Chryseobacterium antibioticum]|uniref:DUF3592 domain-containing protein n=1 Tax=Chryseobacterium pyrolae TaxID=2987481 RepID=A0ABT2IMN8_9FLAO|nr:hypothetical protein [Chryseobacterium pyrolae]MCT2409757.1 hypothetical protein [Chryseobacterium pyrolae]
MGKEGFVEKGFVFLFICLLMISINSLTMILSYTFFWEKAYRSVSENQYEAVVIGYKKEITRTQNFRSSSYHNTAIYFPKVKYVNSEGKEVIKVVDMTSNHPPSLGQTLNITDNRTRRSANNTDINGLVFIFGCIFTGVAAFFAILIATYTTEYSLKIRITISAYGALILCVINGIGVLLIYLRQ